MSVFKRLFSGKKKAESNKNSEYLTNAYDSLGEEVDLNPDKIMDENSLEFSSGQIEEDTVFTTSRHDDMDGVFGVAENNNDYSWNAETDNKEIEYDENAYDTLISDTAEIDKQKIEETAKKISDYMDSDYKLSDGYTSYGEDYIPEDLAITTDEDFDSDDKYNNPDNIFDDEYIDDEIQSDHGIEDLDVIYSAYAPKSMKAQTSEKSYVDLEDVDKVKRGKVRKKKKEDAAKRRMKWIIGSVSGAVVVVGIVVLAIFLFSGNMDPLMGYSQAYVNKGNVIKTMSASGSVEPNARYEITSLVSGTITESPLNSGDAVKAGELVYKVDDTNAQLAVQMAENAVKRAQVKDTDSSSNDSLKIYANASGVISNLKIKSGSVLTGGQIATITQTNGTEIGLIPNVTGTVQTVSVKEGANIVSGQVIATLKSDTGTTSKEGQEIDIAASKLALEQAEKELYKYKVAAPVDGVILVKNAKIGDNISAGAEKPLMVIADMSKMKFTIEVDELEIWNIQQGQTVVVTANALLGQTFSGEITNIAGEGENKGNGVTTYKVEITVSEPGKLKSGMNVDAKIIINSAINVLSLPEIALYETDGQNALVITKSTGNSEDDRVDPADYPNINIPEGYNLVKVQYGVSDGTDVEILSGIAVGDVVLYNESSTSTLVSSDPSNAEKNRGQNSDPQAKTDDPFSGGLDGLDDNIIKAEPDDDDEKGENLRSTGKSAVNRGFNDL